LPVSCTQVSRFPQLIDVTRACHRSFLPSSCGLHAQDFHFLFVIIHLLSLHSVWHTRLYRYPSHFSFFLSSYRANVHVPFEDKFPRMLFWTFELNVELLHRSTMFGCVVAGRLIQTNLQQIDETHAIFELPNVSTINHICVFLTAPFPDGYGATVHFHWPGKGSQLLGGLSNDKPSAIFRLRGSFSSQSTFNHASFQGVMDSSPAVGDITAILGISVEPLGDIQTQLSSLPSVLVKSQAPPDAKVLAEKIVKHLFNYLSSFVAGSGGSSSVLAPDSYVQMGVVTKWYESFMNKARSVGIGFLDNQD